MLIIIIILNHFFQHVEVFSYIKQKQKPNQTKTKSNPKQTPPNILF